MHASIWLFACCLAVSGVDSDSAVEQNERPAQTGENSPLRPIPADQVRLEPIPPSSGAADDSASASADEPARAPMPEIITHLAAPVVVRPQSSQWKPAPPAIISDRSNTRTTTPPANPIRSSNVTSVLTNDRNPVEMPRTAASRAEALRAEPSRAAASQVPVSQVPASRAASEVGQPLREESLSPAQRIAGLPPPRELGTLIRPVNFQQADASGAPSGRSTAGLLIQTAMIPPEDPDWALTGQAAPLAAIIDRAADRSQRSALIRAYWRSHADICAYNWAVEEGAFIAGVSPTPQPSDQSLLMAARLESQAHLQRTRLAATGSQVDLAEISRFPARTLPLPSDTPLVTAYQTKFDKIFANRTPPAGLRRVAVSIPLQKQLLDTTAEAVASATDAVRELNDEFQQGQTSLISLLDAHRRLRKQRLEFLDVVRAYNESVADYAVALGGSVNTDTLVSMLIPVSATSRTAQASRTEPTTVRDYRDPRDINRGYPNVPATGGAVRGASGMGTPANGFGTPASGFAPPSTGVPSGAGSSRPGNWMSPRTSIRDGSVQGSANVAPSLNTAPSNWNGDVRREPPAATRPNTAFQSPPSPSFDGDTATRFSASRAAAAPAFTAQPTVTGQPAMTGQSAIANQPAPGTPTAFAAQPAMTAVPTIRANPTRSAVSAGSGGFAARELAAPPPSAPPSTAPPSSEPPASAPPPNEVPPASEAPVPAPPGQEVPVSVPPESAPPPPSQPGETFESPGGDFVPPPDGFIPPEPGSQLGKPQ